MAFICLDCLTVSGTMASRTKIVKATMLSPKLLKKTAYNRTRLLTIGWMSTAFQASPSSSNGFS